MTAKKHRPVEAGIFVRGQRVIPAIERIMSLSIPEPNSGCWLWVGALRVTSSGLAYGRLVIGSRTDQTRRSVSAHRYAYETLRGPIPAGMVVCHKCDIPSCVNPDHLRVGTQQDNMLDALRKGRIRNWLGPVPPPPSNP